MGAAPCKVLCPGVAASRCPWPHLRLLIGVSNLRGELCWVSLRGLPWWEGGPEAAGSPWSPDSMGSQAVGLSDDAELSDTLG